MDDIIRSRRPRKERIYITAHSIDVSKIMRKHYNNFITAQYYFPMIQEKKKPIVVMIQRNP